MRITLALVLALAGCAAKKPPAKQPNNVETKQLDQDKDERNGDAKDDKDDAPKKGGDPCEGGE
jgi:hypothetical protein